MAQIVSETLMKEKIEVSVYNLSLADIGDIAKDLVDSRAIVFATLTVLGGMHPLALYATYLAKNLHPPAKYGVILSSYGWSGEPQNILTSSESHLN